MLMVNKKKNTFFFNIFFFIFYFSGISSPHTSHFSVWPMSILIHAITSNSDQEIIEDLNMLKTTNAGTNFMHESFGFFFHNFIRKI